MSHFAYVMWVKSPPSTLFKNLCSSYALYAYCFISTCFMWTIACVCVLHWGCNFSLFYISSIPTYHCSSARLRHLRLADQLLHSTAYRGPACSFKLIDEAVAASRDIRCVPRRLRGGLTRVALSGSAPRGGLGFLSTRSTI